MKLVPVLANGQAGAALYMRSGDRHVAFQLHVIDFTRAGVAHVVAFRDAGLFARFGLPGAL
jgi:RNA polymerase sigma-70 factor (ECF subfamily)